MRIGISGTHGTGKTTLAEALSARLPGHVTADEPYYLLEEEGCEFAFPPSLEDYQALLARSIRSMSSPLLRVVFDRTPLDYLAYLTGRGRGPCSACATGTARSFSPTWKRWSAWPTGVPAEEGNSRPRPRPTP
jgi:hypothetical protein